MAPEVNYTTLEVTDAGTLIAPTKRKATSFGKLLGAGKRRTRYVVDDHCCTVGFVVTRLHCTRRRWIDPPVAGNRTRRFRY